MGQEQTVSSELAGRDLLWVLTVRTHRGLLGKVGLRPDRVASLVGHRPCRRGQRARRTGLREHPHLPLWVRVGHL